MFQVHHVKINVLTFQNVRISNFKTDIMAIDISHFLELWIIGMERVKKCFKIESAEFFFRDAKNCKWLEHNLVVVPDITIKKIQRHVNMKKITLCCSIIGLCGLFLLILSIVGFIYIPIVIKQNVFDALNLNDEEHEAYSNFVSNLYLI